jgi:hypothetical protein
MCCCWRLPHLPLFGSSSVAGGRGGKTEPAGPLRFEGAWCVRFAAWSELLGRWWFGTKRIATPHTPHTNSFEILFFVRRSNYLFFSWLLEMNGLGTPGVIEWRSV